MQVMQFPFCAMAAGAIDVYYHEFLALTAMDVSVKLTGTMRRVIQTNV